MSFVNYGDDYQYAKSRLCGTIVKVENHPDGFINVDMIHTHKGIVEGRVVHKDTYWRGHLDELDTSPIDIGWVNFQQGVKTCFMSRIPARFYKQGLCSENVRSDTGFCNMWSSSFLRTLQNKYPTPYEAAEFVLNQESNRVGVTRRVALAFSSQSYEKDGKMNMLFGTTVVGKASVNHEMGNINWHLDPKFDFLSQALEEEFNGTEN